MAAPGPVPTNGEVGRRVIALEIAHGKLEERVAGVKEDIARVESSTKLGREETARQIEDLRSELARRERDHVKEKGDEQLERQRDQRQMRVVLWSLTGTLLAALIGAIATALLTGLH